MKATTTKQTHAHTRTHTHTHTHTQTHTHTLARAHTKQRKILTVNLFFKKRQLRCH